MKKMANTLPNLSSGLLDQLREHGDSNLQLPTNSLLNAPETILQLGFGKFLRGYVTDFVQIANQQGHYWGRILVVQRKADHRTEAFARQNGLYTLVLRGLENGEMKEVKRVLGSVSRLLVAEEDWDEVMKAVRKPQLRVILSNATETGLVIEKADRADDKPPRNFPGKLTQLLYARWCATKGQDADIAVLPTELVVNNGPLVKNLILEQARLWNLDANFLDWVQNSVHVASTIVDRIVVGTPAEEFLNQECQALGYRDELLTGGEPFYLLAITGDEFIRQNFPLHLALPCVRFVDDLAPFRRRKLRLLNGPQMVLTTLGTLLDFALVREVVKDPQIGKFTQQTVYQEILPAMGTEDEAINSEYARESLDRIGNPNIVHRLAGIRVDLTAKNCIRLIPSIRDYIALRDELPGRLLLTIAATLEVVVRGGLQDAHAEYIIQRWKTVDAQSHESLLAFTRDSLIHLLAQTNEELDVDRIVSEVCDLLMEIRQHGLRKVLAQRYSC
jgi:tagaturonate reductase